VLNFPDLSTKAFPAFLQVQAGLQPIHRAQHGDILLS
jgi:hypothetical protein